MKLKLTSEQVQQISVVIAASIAAILTALFVDACTVNRIVRSVNSEINNEMKVDSVSTGINTQL